MLMSKNASTGREAPCWRLIYRHLRDDAARSTCANLFWIGDIRHWWGLHVPSCKPHLNVLCFDWSMATYIFCSWLTILGTKCKRPAFCSPPVDVLFLTHWLPECLYFFKKATSPGHPSSHKAIRVLACRSSANSWRFLGCRDCVVALGFC